VDFNVLLDTMLLDQLEQSRDWYKTLSLLNQSLDWYWQN